MVEQNDELDPKKEMGFHLKRVTVGDRTEWQGDGKEINQIPNNVIEHTKAWYRQEGETMLNYKLFKMFCAQPYNVSKRGAAVRSINRLAMHVRLTARHIHNLAYQWQWVARAEAYDAHLLEIEEQAHKERLREEGQLWAARTRLLREFEWEAAEKLIERGREMLEHPLFIQRMKEAEMLSEDGKVIVQQITELHPADWTISDVAKLFDLASKLARLATNQATSHAQMNVNIDFDKLSDDELKQLVQTHRG
jgi:hypothetical protein